MPVTVRGLDNVLRNFDALSARLHREADDFLLREAQRILDESLQLVPHDTGEVARSGEVKRTGGRVGVGVERANQPRGAGGRFTSGGWAVAYGKDGDAANYAHVLHEHPSEHDPPSWQGKQVQFNGGQPKYLEIPFRKAAGNLPQRLAAHLRGKLRP